MSGEWLSVTDSDAVMPWSISVDGFFRKSVENRMLADDMTEEAIDSIFNNAARILGRCPNPNIQEQVAETGIVIGKVQSGKTSNFISVLALAFDNGYDIAIVLGGNTLNLLKQNASRISSAFSVDTEKLTVLKTNDNKTLINPARIKDFIENGRKVIIVGLKHNKHINQIAEIFDNEFLADKSVLIIDDEGDQATLNTRAYQQSISTTYASVLNLKNKLKSHCFLSVTATPQANILIEAFDKLSPDFGELVYPGEGYCGLQEFHGENADRYIKEIPESEPNLLDGMGVPESVYQAMALFFVGNAIRRSRGDMGTHAMLIHPSQKKFDHRVVEQKIQSILDEWKSKAKTRLAGKKDISYNSLKNLLQEAYDSFVSDGVICHPFDDLENQILDRIKQCSPVLICNSEENASENAELYKTNIFVGGNLVERGITFKGLAVTYITRRARGKSNVDNTEQRARWFGYKAKYLDVCRVFTTRDIKDDFASILEHDEDMWASIERAQERGIPFKDMPRIFVLQRNAYLNLTRRNVARTENFALSEWKSQKYYIADREIVNQNADVIAKYRQHYAELLQEQKHNSVQVHMVLEGQQYGQVYSELLDKIQFANNEILDKQFFAQLNDALIKLELDIPVDVYWIRDINHSTRKIREDYTIQQLFQGRNPNPSSPLYYDGDRSLADNEPEHIQLQIHFVKPTNMPEIDYYSPVFALYVPESCTARLSELVVKSNG
ncbi:Z1 domain-containing protein [Ruminococcaceae bacterium FB2012]|nr:Z1 domain-containing protein [Ruminococcaceae bacterium FB2012]